VTGDDAFDPEAEIEAEDQRRGTVYVRPMFELIDDLNRPQGAEIAARWPNPYPSDKLEEQ